MSLLKHFYRQTYQQKIALLSKLVQLSDDASQMLTDDYSATGNQLIENYITNYELPEGVAVNLMVNGRECVAPMVTEEPSVIAAASNGSRLLSKAGGTTVEVLGQNLMGQIVLQTTESNLVIGFVHTHKNDLLKIANQSHPSILQYGGGAQKLRVRKLDNEYVSIDLFVNVGEAMGANIMNSMLEAVASYLEPRLPKTVLMSILSNYADSSLVKVQGRVPVKALGTTEIAGEKVAKRIEAASHVAQVDVYRATTHNKGIMNGIDAVVMAMGNDWRAVEASVHAYASHDGKYRGLSKWNLEGAYLVGTMTLPLALGFVGGATKIFPKVKINQHLAQINSKDELISLVASVGLAQNLAALKALVTEGIQKGHMNLQLNSLIMSAGADPHEVAIVSHAMKQKNSTDLATARAILKQVRGKNKGD